MNLSFAQYLNVRWAGGPSFRSDGERMAFLTDITGTAQLWTVDSPLGWPEQLTFFEDRLTFAEYSPTEPVIAFGRDAGGDENTLVFLVSDEGGAVERVSVHDAKHLWGGFSPDGQRMAWSHNGRNGRDFDVYLYDLAAGEERMIVEGDGYWYVAEWLDDGSALIVSHYSSNADNDLYLVRLDGSERIHLTPHDEDAVFMGATATPDGSRIFVASNFEGEFSTLAEIDLGTRELRVVDPAAPWDVDGLAMSDDGRFLAVIKNEGGYSRLRLRDLEKHEETTVEGLPGGVIADAKWLPHESRLAVTVAAAADATDVWVVDVRTSETERWTRSAMAGIPRSSLIEPELVEFTSFDGLKVPAFYWKPETPAPYPVLIDIHGGPEAQRRPSFMATVQYFLQRGLAVFAPNVRGSRGYGKTYMSLDDVRKRMHSVADIQAAREWLVSTGGADPRRIALKGGSYGGFMVLSAMVTYPDLWACGIDIVGIANFVTFLENTSEYRRHLREPEYGSLERDREFLHDISPLTHIHKINAPLMVIHGRNDPRVPVSEAEQVVEACRAKGLPVECIIYDDEGHGLAKRANRLDAYPKMLAFLEEHLAPR